MGGVSDLQGSETGNHCDVRNTSSIYLHFSAFYRNKTHQTFIK